MLVEKLFCSFFNPLISLYIYYDQYEKNMEKKIVLTNFARFVSMEMAAIFDFRALTKVHLYLYNTNSVCVCVCLSSIGGQTAGPIMTTFGTHMRIDLGMVPTKYWPHEWPGSVGSLGPISESGLSCQLLLRAVVWQMTSQ